MYCDTFKRKIFFIFAALTVIISSAYIAFLNNADDHYHINADSIVGNENKYFYTDPDAGYTTSYQVSNENKYYIHIDLDVKRLYLYNKGELVKSYPASGGKMSTPSPFGKWVIINKASWGEGFGGRWMGLNVPWGTYGIHGTKSPWFVGKSNISNGCIRMKNEDIADLYNIVPHGTIVTIVQKSAPFRSLKSGDFGSDVRDIQVKLKDKGYFNGYVSGIFTEDLKQAVIKFQKDNNLPVTGVVYRSTYDIIMK